MERNSKKHTNHRRGGRRKERKDTIRRRRWPLVSPRRFFFLVTVEPACRGPGQVTIVRITGKVCHSVLALSLLLLLSSVRAALPSQTVLFLDPPVVLVSFVLTFFFPSESWPLSAFDFRTLPPPCAALFVVWASPPKQKFPHRYESDGGDFSFCLKPFSARSMLHDACCQSCSQPLFLFPFSYPYIFEADQVLRADIFRLLGPAGLPIFARTIVVVSSNKPPLDPVIPPRVLSGCTGCALSDYHVFATHLPRSSSRGKGEAPAFVVVVLLRLVLGRAGGDDPTVAAKTPTAHLEHGGRLALGACSHGPCAAAVVRAAAFRTASEKGINEKVVQREYGAQ